MCYVSFFCQSGKRLQRKQKISTDGRSDIQPENIMPPAASSMEALVQAIEPIFSLDREQIATEFFLAQCISTRSPEHHTKSPKKSLLRKYV